MQASSGRSHGRRTVLVAARADRGTATLRREELDAYCHRCGIPPYISTSAKEGEGMKELIARLQASIPWDEKPATVTTDTFQAGQGSRAGAEGEPEGSR